MVATNERHAPGRRVAEVRSEHEGEGGACEGEWVWETGLELRVHGGQSLHGEERPGERGTQQRRGGGRML